MCMHINIFMTNSDYKIEGHDAHLDLEKHKWKQCLVINVMKGHIYTRIIKKS